MLASSLNTEVCASQPESSMQGKHPRNTNHTAGNSHQSDTMSSRKEFPCNTCDLVFEVSQAQRMHMREPWHIYNLKRRMADLPPISADDYTENVVTNVISKKIEGSVELLPSTIVEFSKEDESAGESDEPKDPIHGQKNTHCCLFCTHDSISLEANLNHMSLEHDLYLPHIEHLSSLESFIGYLRTIVTEYKECLYCGVTKRSLPGIRRHMRDKGHCMINLEREPELLEFWELSDSDENGSDTEEEAPPLQTEEPETLVHADLSQGEYVLPSGKIVGSKIKAREARLHARRPASTSKRARDPTRTVTESSIGDSHVESSLDIAGPLVENRGGNQNRAVATRDAAGLLGVSDQKIRSLATLERKTQRQQAVVQASRSWAGDKGGIHQRHYKVKMNLRDG